MASEFVGVRSKVCSQPAGFITRSKLDPVLIDRYGSDLTPDQKDALLDVIRVRPHPPISAEIRREIVSSMERGAVRPEDEGDVVMK